MDRLLCDLKIVGTQRAGDRIYQDGGSLQIMHPSLTGSVWRMVRGDSRATSVAAVTACLSEALALADEHCATWRRATSGPQDADGVERLKDRALHLLFEIEAASAGLRHMKLTYADDLSVSARLGVLSERVHAQLDILKGVLGVPRQTSPTLRHMQAPLLASEVLILTLADS